MIIAEALEKCKTMGRAPRDVVVLTVLILASSASFGLGYLAGLDTGEGSGVAVEPSFVATSTARQIVASKTGASYYLPGCAGANRISDANKVWFASAATAQAAGYAPAKNCEGL